MDKFVLARRSSISYTSMILCAELIGMVTINKMVSKNILFLFILAWGIYGFLSNLFAERISKHVNVLWYLQTSVRSFMIGLVLGAIIGSSLILFIGVVFASFGLVEILGRRYLNDLLED